MPGLDATAAGGPPLGEPVPGWTTRPRPPETPMIGRTCRLERLDGARHGPSLWRAWSEDVAGEGWTSLSYGPFADEDALTAFLEEKAAAHDPLFFAVVDAATDRALGVASYLRIDPANGVIEVGHIHYAPALRRTAIATEAMALMMARVFDELGYRRYEWKCNALNAASMAAARRLGFSFEGIFRQALVSKGRNRDTAWFSIIDKEWPRQKARFSAFLDPSNFDEAGRQRRPLARD